MPRRYKPATLGSVLDRPNEEVWLGCYECEHRGIVDIAALIPKLGRDFPIPELKKLGHCQRCGARNAYVQLSFTGRIGLR
jgi:hypothetical protein